MQHQSFDEGARAMSADQIESVGLGPLGEIEVRGVLEQQYRPGFVLANTPGSVLDVRGEHGVQMDPGVGEEAVAGLELGERLEAARESLAAVPTEVNQKGAKTTLETPVAEGNIGELVLDPLLGTAAHGRPQSRGNSDLRRTTAYRITMWVKLSAHPLSRICDELVPGVIVSPGFDVV